MPASTMQVLLCAFADTLELLKIGMAELQKQIPCLRRQARHPKLILLGFLGMTAKCGRQFFFQ